ncbi:MAG: macrolide transporter ATP-binding/permease protein [Verrucomicrobiales bacterium]|nr:macrolide transporter ATP-binding/permease protein [Verrucomicrobiales bacterium]
MNDIRFAFRQLLKTPGFTFVALLTLALGIGANTAIFSVTRAVMLRPLPFGEPERIVQVWTARASSQNYHIASSIANFVDWKTQNHCFTNLAYYRLGDFHFTGTGNPLEVRAARVSEEFFDVLDVPPLLGRTLLPEENIPGRDNMVVLSYGIWQRRFGGASNIIGNVIGIEGKNYTVCGVMPSEFRFPERAEIWVPYAITLDQIGNKRGDHFNSVIGRLNQGATIESSRTELAGIMARLEKQYPDANEGLSTTLVQIHEDMVSDFKPALLLLLGAVGAVLLIACANIANLQLARGVTRQKEIAIRSALGATRSRIIVQLLTESVFLSVSAGVLGLIIAHATLLMLIKLAPANIPRIEDARLDTTVMLVCFFVSVGTGIVFGLLPALQGSRVEINQSVNDGGKGVTDSIHRTRSRNILVVVEIALALMLLVGAGLLVQSYHKLTRVPLGFNPDDLATVRISLPWWKYHVTGSDRTFFKNLYDRLRSQPGLENCAFVCALPIADRQTSVWFKPTTDTYQPGKEPVAGFNYVTPSYFQTLGIPFFKGRNLDHQDVYGAPRVVVVDETLVQHYFKNRDPMGAKVHIEGQGDEPFTIVGIVGGVRQKNPSRPPAPQLYMQYQQINEATMWFVVRGASRLGGLEKLLAREVQALDVDQSISPLRSMQQHIVLSSQLPRFRTFLLVLMASLAFVLSAIGVYSVIAFSVVQRTREFGIRMALGAIRRDILKLVFTQGGKLAFAGVALGTGLSIGASRLLSSMLFEVSPTDLATFIIIPLILTSVALLASYLPALSATRLDPMVALRHD